MPSVQSFQASSGGTLFSLCRLQGQLDVLKQILALEKKVFAKKASWTGVLENEVKRRNTTLFYVVAASDQVVAYIIFTTTQLVVQITKLGVHPSCRRQGIARHLLQVSISAAKAQRHSLQCGSLNVDSSNTAAVELYKSFGFQQDSFLSDYYAPGSHALKMLYTIPC